MKQEKGGEKKRQEGKKFKRAKINFLLPGFQIEYKNKTPVGNPKFKKGRLNMFISVSSTPLKLLKRKKVNKNGVNPQG